MLGLALLVLVLYAVYGWRPFVVQTWTVVDDGLYVRQAAGFLGWLSGKGEGWLGKFDCFLLAKAPLCGLWMAGLSVLGLPLRVGEFLLLLAGAGLFVRALRPVHVLRSWQLGLVLFLFVANPAVPEDFYLHRTTLQIGLTNLTLAMAIGLALRADAGPGPLRRWGFGLGLAFSLCYLNREEATWMMAAVAVAFAIVVGTALLAWRRGAVSRRSALAGPTAIALAFVLGFAPLVTAVCALNQKYYGAFITTFRRSSALTGLVQRLTSLEPARRQPYVPVARPTRFEAYALSPTLKLLYPFLDGPKGYWRAGNPEHAALNGRKPEELELFVSYFEFALLWAASEAGAKRADSMEDLFRAADRELLAAVRAGRIVAGRSGPAILAPPGPGDYGRIAKSFMTSLGQLLSVANAGYGWPDESVPQSSRSKLDEVGKLIGAHVGTEPLPNLHQATRAPLVRLGKRLDRVLFPLLFLGVPALLVWRRRELWTAAPSPRTLLLWSLLVPCVGLGAFCFSMAMVDVLGFKFLAGIAYNVLGYGPLSVLCALSLVAWLVFLPSRAREAVRPASTIVAESTS
jgi:hypothetical protein